MAPVARIAVVAMILFAVCAAASSELPLTARQLLQTDQSKPSGTDPKACCNCVCVIPGKSVCNGRPNCVGVTAPTYKTKQFCINGFAKSCDDVCLETKGSATFYHSC